ncbi:MAG: E3 binding domain-containing protein, partial [Ruminococcus sp.]|nr:E3 binding domain-containing protein [Ruminococcus sp.]
MAQKVIMPKQGLQMTEGTITNWIVKEGGICKADEPLFEMETDKLTITISSEIDGTLLKIIRGEGEVVPITEIIAVIGQPGEDISAILAEASSQNSANDNSAEQDSADTAEKTVENIPEAPTETITRAENERIFITPRAKELAIEKGIDYSIIKGSGEDGLIIEADIKNAKVDSIKATPLAIKDAKSAGIDLHSVSGTGIGGKIRRADIAAAIE